MPSHLVEVYRTLAEHGPNDAYRLLLAKSSRNDLFILFGALVALYLGNWMIQYISVLRQVRGLPVIHSAIEFMEHGARGKLPNISFISPAKRFTLDEPWKKYADAHSDLIALTQLSTPEQALYMTSSPSVAQMISMKVATFPKPIEMFRYRASNLFGTHLVSLNGDDWRRHKNVIKGCFGESVMENAWVRMAEAYEVMIKEEGVETGGVVENVYESMIKLTLLVIGKAGFGVDIPWTIPKTKSGDMAFHESLHIVETTLVPQLLLPLWSMLYFPSAKVRRIGQAQVQLRKRLVDMYQQKLSELKRLEEEYVSAGEKIPPPSDILGALVYSQLGVEAEGKSQAAKVGGKVVEGLTESEFLGNLFIFVIAGHETAGHTLTFTLAYLALHPEWQDKLYDEVAGVCGDGLPTYRDMNQLPLCLAACYEALRLRDLAMLLPKRAIEDTVIPYTTWDDEGNVTHHTRAIKKGSRIIIDFSACSHNPFAYHDAMAFDPTRFLDRQHGEGSVFIGFSWGPRQCIGKRFAEIEMTAFISHVVKQYKFSPIAKPGETSQQMKDRYLAGHQELSFMPAEFPLKFERR